MIGQTDYVPRVYFMFHETIEIMKNKNYGQATREGRNLNVDQIIIIPPLVQNDFYLQTKCEVLFQNYRFAYTHHTLQLILTFSRGYIFQ